LSSKSYKEGKPEISQDSVFSDVDSGVWYESPVAWAQTNNIINGMGDGRFAPDEEITREQMAVIIYNYAKSKGRVSEENIDLTFSDEDSIHDWAYDAINWCVANGIMNGKGNNILDPLGLATRAEIATMIMNFCEM